MNVMKILKVLLIILVAVGMLASASAANVKMDIFPSNDIAEPNEDFIVFGYIYDDQLLDESDLKIKVYEDGDLLKSYTPNFHGLNGDEPSTRGYFYKVLDIDNLGDYDIKLKINGNTEATHDIEIENMAKREVEIKDFDAYISGDKIVFNIEVENRDNEDHDVNIYLKGENNFKSPKTFSIDVDAGEKEEIRKSYPATEFGSNDFIVVAQARTDSGNKESYSTAKYAFVDGKLSYNYDYYDNYQYNYPYSEPQYYNYPAYGYGNLVITDVELDTAVFYPGDVVEGKVYIKNIGSHESQYRFEYIYDNHAYKMGDVGYVLPQQVDVQDIVIEIPDTESFKLTTKVISGTTDTDERTYLVSQKIKYFSPILSEENLYVDAGENATVLLTLKNRGNENDMYKIKIEGWESYKMKDSIAIDAESEEEIEITFEVPESSKVGMYPIVLDIENSNGMHRSETLQLSVIKAESEQSGVIFEDKLANRYFEQNETIEYSLIVTNKELEDKDYFVEVDAGDAEVTIDSESFILEYEGEREIEIHVTPSEAKNHEVDIKVYANGEKIFRNEVPLEYTENKDRKLGSGITGFAIWEGSAWMPGVYLLALIGLVSLGYMGYKFVNEKRETEKVVKYNLQHQRPQPLQPIQPKQPTQQKYGQWTTPRLPQTKDEYHEDSFMRKF